MNLIIELERLLKKILQRSVVDGRKHRGIYSKAKVSSPTVSLEGFLRTLVIDATEEWQLDIADVASAFLKADMVDFVAIK